MSKGNHGRCVICGSRLKRLSPCRAGQIVGPSTLRCPTNPTHREQVLEKKAGQ